ncbi:MAG TPA: glycosyltransferase family 2 protein [Ignavibacteria bacterium]
MQKDVTLSIVIVNWNSRNETLNCLKSIFDISDFKERENEFEIIVIDNDSKDGSVSAINSEFPSVTILKNNSNIGYAPACNIGLKMAEGKYVLLLGNDTIMKNGSLSGTINFLENDLNCGAVGCRLVYPDGNLQGNCKKFPKLINAFYTYLSFNNLNRDYDMLWFDYDKTMEVDQIATTFLMVRNEILKKINYFDEQYKILYNDVDLCRKIWNSGFKIYFLHTAEIVHIGSHSTTKAGFGIRKIMYRDILKYFRNNFGLRAYFLLPVLFFRILFVTFLKQ